LGIERQYCKETVSHATTQQTCGLLGNSKVQYRVHKNKIMDPFTNQSSLEITQQFLYLFED